MAQGGFYKATLNLQPKSQRIYTTTALG